MTFRPLSEALQEKAENELHEVRDQVQEDLNHIRQWLLTQPHLKARTDDQWLLSFLRSCKFNLQRTKEKLELFYTKKMQIPEFFANRDPFLPEIQEVLKRGIVTILPKTANPAGPKIIFFRAERADPVRVPIAIFTKVFLMIIEILYLEDDNSVVAGIRSVVHLNDLPYKYLMQLTPSYIKKITVCLLNAYPTRLKGVHFVNMPSFFQIVFKLIRIFLPEKLRNRLQLHNDFDNLSKDVPNSILPKEFGGEGRSCDEIAAEWKLKIEGYRDWFLEDVHCEAEKLRNTETTTEEIDEKRSFGKLEID